MATIVAIADHRNLSDFRFVEKMIGIKLGVTSRNYTAENDEPVTEIDLSDISESSAETPKIIYAIGPIILKHPSTRPGTETTLLQFFGIDAITCIPWTPASDNLPSIRKRYIAKQTIVSAVRVWTLYSDDQVNINVSMSARTGLDCVRTVNLVQTVSKQGY